MSKQPDVEPHLTDTAEDIRRFGRMLLAKKNVQDADAAVIEAAEDYIGKNMTEESLVENRWGHQPERIRLGLAVVRRRKALAEQAKEASRG